MGRGEAFPSLPSLSIELFFLFFFLPLSLSVSSPFIFQRATIRTVWKFMYPRPVGVSITDIVSGRHKAKFRDFDVYSIPPTKFRPPSLPLGSLLKGGEAATTFPPRYPAAKICNSIENGRPPVRNYAYTLPIKC